jgi:hypothetical protein
MESSMQAVEDFMKKSSGNGDYQRNVLKYVVFKLKYPDDSMTL